MDMRRQVELKYYIFESIQHLTAEDRTLLEEALHFADKSYSPYSHFQVGAAARLSSGKVVGGSNQENAAFPMCVCAEQVVLTQCGALHPDDPILSMAVTARSTLNTEQKPVSPCGGCRQAMVEYTHRQGMDFRLLLGGSTGSVYLIEKAQDLLPLSFNPTDL
jgi:cytidine deaminase